MVPFSRDAYIKQVEQLKKFIPLLNGSVAATIKNGMNMYWKTQSPVNLYKTDVDINLFSSQKSSNKFLKKIKNTMKKKNPLILSVGGKVFWKKGADGPVMQRSNGSLIDFSNTYYHLDNHYVTVTGVLVDKQKNTCKLQVSSWGEKYYVDYDKIYKYVDKHSSSVLCDAIFVSR